MLVAFVGLGVWAHQVGTGRSALSSTVYTCYIKHRGVTSRLSLCSYSVIDVPLCVATPIAGA
eukprot:54275-Eustigmatos_ZCMA.PRE.1